MSSSPTCAVEQDPVHNALRSPEVLQVKDKTPPWPSHKTSEGWGHSSVSVVLAQQATSPGFSLQLHRWSMRHTHTFNDSIHEEEISIQGHPCLYTKF